MQLMSRFSKGICSLLCVIDTYSKYANNMHYFFKGGVTITNAFQKCLDESNRKPNKIRLDKGSECYNRSVKR